MGARPGQPPVPPIRQHARKNELKPGKFNVILDAMHGSSGKGKVSTFLADRFNVTNVSSSNFPNAGHSAVSSDGMVKFVAKAIPTSAILKRINGMGVKCWISPGSGFSWEQLIKEWEETGRPDVVVHGRASIVTPEHARREREGAMATKHIGSTMQGSGAALVDKVMRLSDCRLARDVRDELSGLENVRVVTAEDFRDGVHREIAEMGQTWLHEGSQGYALSIDHGSHYPACTARNCTLQAAMDQMAIPPAMVGDVYLNLRTFPIRVGNVVEDGVEVGNSGGFYPDARELTWGEVADRSGMPAAEAAALAERERTTVTKRIRRVFDFSFMGLRDAVRTNGATKLVLNFVQYVNWKDAGLKGEGPAALQQLSRESREFMARIEDAVNVPIVLVGTGARHDEMISLLT